MLYGSQECRIALRNILIHPDDMESDLFSHGIMLNNLVQYLSIQMGLQWVVLNGTHEEDGLRTLLFAVNIHEGILVDPMKADEVVYLN